MCHMSSWSSFRNRLFDCIGVCSGFIITKDPSAAKARYDKITAERPSRKSQRSSDTKPTYADKGEHMADVSSATTMSSSNPSSSPAPVPHQSELKEVAEDNTISHSPPNLRARNSKISRPKQKKSTPLAAPPRSKFLNTI